VLQPPRDGPTSHGDPNEFPAPLDTDTELPPDRRLVVAMVLSDEPLHVPQLDRHEAQPHSASTRQFRQRPTLATTILWPHSWQGSAAYGSAPCRPSRIASVTHPASGSTSCAMRFTATSTYASLIS